MYRIVCLCASVFVLVACGPTDPDPAPNVTVDCSQELDTTTIDCGGGNVNAGGNIGGDGGSGGTDGGEASIRDDVCVWKYNPGNPWEAICWPQLANGRAVASVSVRIDPANEDFIPVFKPMLAMTKKAAFGDQVDVISEDEDPSKYPEQWSHSHWIVTRPHEVIDLDGHDYGLLFSPFDGNDVGPILETAIEYDP